MDWQGRASNIRDIERFAELAVEAGAKSARRLLQRDPGEWRGMMRRDAQYRSWGTLRFLLDEARDKFATEPTVALQITAAVIDFADTAQGPSRIHEVGLRALARKEHAHACEAVGKLPAALEAAQRSVEIYGEEPTLLCDQTLARLVVCMVLREMGRAEEALQLARACEAVFVDFGDLTSANMARMYEACSLFTARQFSAAFEIFLDVMEKAELEGDRLTVARCLHSGAACARELGDLDSARDLYPRALEVYEDLKRTDAANQVRWGYALTLAAEGRVSAAVMELYRVRAAFLEMGKNSHAASAALDIVRLRFDAGEDVRSLCSDLVNTFTAAGMTQNAIETLSYLREQARQEKLTPKLIRRVQTYFEELAKMPTMLFIHPPEEEG